MDLTDHEVNLCSFKNKLEVMGKENGIIDTHLAELLWGLHEIMDRKELVSMPSIQESQIKCN